MGFKLATFVDISATIFINQKKTNKKFMKNIRNKATEKTQ